MKLNLKHLVYDPDRRGNPRYYVRVPGRKKVRLRDKPGSAEFLAAYQAAISDPTPQPSNRLASGTFAWLVHRYYQSAEYRVLDRRTQHVRSLILAKIVAEHGNALYKRLDRSHVRQLRDDRFDRPEAANSVVKALRQVYKWAIEAGLAETNPARDVPYLKSRPGGIHTWTVAEVERYRKRHPIGTRARLALELLALTGVRRSDVVRLGLPMVRDGWLCFTEAKNAGRKPKERALPILPQLQAVIDASPFVGMQTFLVTEYGRPFSPDGFGNKMRAWCREAGLPQCSAHGLRKAGATIAAENGATDRQLMAIFGWVVERQVTTYTREADQKRIVGDAMGLIVRKE